MIKVSYLSMKSGVLFFLFFIVLIIYYGEKATMNIERDPFHNKEYSHVF